ncbi:MAG: hypothetical protein JSS81_29625 [Acidobacteria bacterium]|nr:hypothetical protein [Acidobacteriota bacterium]
MGQTQTIRKEETTANEPVNIGDRAIDNLRFIRETMERSTVFTSVPGYGGILMGATALVAAYIANTQATIRNWLIVWLTEAVLAFSIGLLAMWQKTKLSKTSLLSNPARKLLMNSLPPMLCGIFITLGLWRFGHFEMMVPVWIICYGAAVVCGGAFSVRAVPAMGWFFIALGALAFFLPVGYGNTMMGLSFGVTQMVFGLIIGRKFGG